MTPPPVRQKQPQASMSSHDVLRIRTDRSVESLSDQIIREEAVTLMVDQVGSFTLLCTPSDLEALAVGFAFSEGLIDNAGDVLEIARKPNLPQVVGLRIQDPTRISEKRNMIVASACGMCGARNIEKLLAELPACANRLTLSSDRINPVVETLQARQDLFRHTGAAHAAGLFNDAGEIFAWAEDLGRHNALDKAIGKSLLAGQDLTGCGAVLSGRVSLEMVTKAARAGLEMIVAVSAPSSLAIQSADHWNMTLCGFVRSDRLNVYTHTERVLVA